MDENSSKCQVSGTGRDVNGKYHGARDSQAGLPLAGAISGFIEGNREEGGLGGKRKRVEWGSAAGLSQGQRRDARWGLPLWPVACGPWFEMKTVGGTVWVCGRTPLSTKGSSKSAPCLVWFVLTNRPDGGCRKISQWIRHLSQGTSGRYNGGGQYSLAEVATYWP